MQIELRHGLAANITPAEKPQGAIECHLDGSKILVHRDLADKLRMGENIIAAGTVHENVLRAVAIKNLSKGTTSQLDPTNNVLALAFSGFIGLISAIQSINANAAGNSAGSIVLAFVAVTGFAAIFFFLQRLIEINKASSRIKYAGEQ